MKKIQLANFSVQPAPANLLQNILGIPRKFNCTVCTFICSSYNFF